MKSKKFIIIFITVLGACFCLFMVPQWYDEYQVRRMMDTLVPAELLREANNGNVAAMREAGGLYVFYHYEGGDTRDSKYYRKGIGWLTKAAEKSDSVSMRTLAYEYANAPDYLDQRDMEMSKRYLNQYMETIKGKETLLDLYQLHEMYAGVRTGKLPLTPDAEKSEEYYRKYAARCEREGRTPDRRIQDIKR